LVCCVTIWISAIRSSLWLDETLSFWQIHGGFSEIPNRQWMTFPAYSYLLWLDTKLLGTSELALRVPSLIATIVAARIVYKSCRELLNDARSGYVGLIFFCAHPYVAFAAIDARPYGFAVLATSLAIYAVIKFRGTAAASKGVLFGCACGLILWFHFLFSVIIPGLFGLMIGPLRGRKFTEWLAICASVATFAIMAVPALPQIVYTFTTRQAHVFSAAPGLFDFVYVALPSYLMLASPLLIVPAEGLWLLWPRCSKAAILCFAVGVVPVSILFLISKFSGIHVFESRYTLVAVPGLAICWALLAHISPLTWGRFLLVSLLLGLGIAPQLMHGPVLDHDGDMRGGLAFADARAQAIRGPIVLCSQFVESEGEGTPMPQDPKSSKLFSPLSYYPVHSQVVPLPRVLNNQTIYLATRFLEDSKVQSRPFVVVGVQASRPVLKWFSQQTSGTYSIQWHEPVGETYMVVEFTPR
jgi:hypothetical protein